MGLIHTMIPVEWPGRAVVRLFEAGIYMDKAKELQLIEEARGCSREAFNQLVECYQKPLKGFISSWSNIQYADAEDIAQEVWGKAWEEIHRSPEEGGYDPVKGGFYTWVVNYIAKHKVKDWRRSKPRSQQSTSASENQNAYIETRLEAPSQSSDPVEMLIREEELYQRLLAYCECFRLTFLCGGCPHEQLAFGFAKPICGEESGRTIESDPTQIDSGYGEERLESLVDMFWDSYRLVSGIDDADLLESVKACLDPVRIRLKLKVKELIQSLPEHLKDTQEEQVAHTCLRDYYPKKSEENKVGKTHPITYWCYRVEQKMRRVFGMSEDASLKQIIQEIAQRLREGPIEPRGCSHCKLRHVPPCVNHKGQEKLVDRQ